MQTALDLDNVVALGPTMADEAETEEAGGDAGASKGRVKAPGAHKPRKKLLGHLLRYSVPEVYLTREELADALDEAGIEESFLPGKVSLRDAFRRASRRIEARRIPAGPGRHANIMLREVKDADTTLVRHLVRETVDSDNVRLDYRQVAQVELTGSSQDNASSSSRGGQQTLALDMSVAVLRLEQDLLPAEEDILRRVVRATEFERAHHDSDAVRRLVTRVLGDACALQMRGAGAFYFVSREYPETLKSVEAFVGEVAARGQAGPSGRRPFVMKVPLVDKEEHRDVLAGDLEEQVERESSSLIHEMSRLLKSGKSISKKRQKGFIQRVNKLTAAVEEYEGLLRTEINSAKSNLDLAMKEAVALVSKVNLKD